jgi:hypothetical protein
VIGVASVLATTARAAAQGQLGAAVQTVAGDCHAPCAAASSAEARPVPVAPTPSSGATTSAPIAPVWEIETHGGFETWDFGFGLGPSPATGADFFGTATGVGVTARVPSWFFGDGAALLAAAPTNAPTFMTPLDPALQGPGLLQRGFLAGFSVSHRLTSWLAAGFAVDGGLSRAHITSFTRGAVTSAGSNYAAEFGGIFTSAPAVFTNASEAAQSTVRDGGRPLRLTGTLTLHLVPRGRIRPFVIAGGGATRLIGSPPTVTLVGQYAFQFVPVPGHLAFSTTGGPVAIDETARLTVRFGDERVRPVGVVGFGFTREMSRRSGVRFAIQAVLGASTSVDVSTAPSSLIGQPAGTVTYGPVKALQFSTVPGVSSSLSVPVTQLQTFNGGFRSQIEMTVGYAVRLGPVAVPNPAPPSVVSGPAHRFFDVTNIAFTGMEISAMLADGAATQYLLRRDPGPDADPIARWFVARGWPGQLLGGALFVSGEVALRYLLHRHNHHQVERLLPFVLTTTGTAGAIGNWIVIREAARGGSY